MDRQFPKGVWPRQKSIRIRFSWGGQQFQESLKWRPTPQNVQRAGRLAAEIRQKVELGVFTWAEYQAYFPDSSRILRAAAPLFGELAQRYLDSLECSDATRRQYRHALNKHWLPHFHGVAIDQIRQSDIKRAIQGNGYETAKTRNNALIPLRGLFDMAVDDEILAKNPAQGIKNLKHQTQNPPDPLSADERDALLEAIQSQASPLYYAYFLFAFHSGLRNFSEIAALKWASVDLRAGSVRVERKVSRGHIVEQTKNAQIRNVRLPEPALEALKLAKPHTYMSSEFVFVSGDGEYFHSGKAPRRVWSAAIRKTGIRHRDMRQTRHTAATQWIMAGLNPAFVAKQLGHSKQMTLNIYAQWIDEQGDEAELAKLDPKKPGSQRTS